MTSKQILQREFKFRNPLHWGLSTWTGALERHFPRVTDLYLSSTWTVSDWQSCDASWCLIVIDCLKLRLNDCHWLAMHCHCHDCWSLTLLDWPKIDQLQGMASGRLPGDFWPRCHGWAPPGAASEESEVDEKSDQSSQAADPENEEGHGEPTAAMKRPSSKKKPTSKSEAKRKPRLKRPASALAMTEPEDSSPSMPSKLTKPRKKPSGTVRPAKKNSREAWQHRQVQRMQQMQMEIGMQIMQLARMWQTWSCNWRGWYWQEPAWWWWCRWKIYFVSVWNFNLESSLSSLDDSSQSLSRWQIFEAAVIRAMRWSKTEPSPFYFMSVSIRQCQCQPA